MGPFLEAYLKVRDFSAESKNERDRAAASRSCVT